MPKDLRSLSLRKIRALLDDGEVSPEQMRVLLADDPRKGVGDLLRLIISTQEREWKTCRRMEELLRLERDLWAAGIKNVAGVDEAGMGPLAGPVVAGAVVFPEEVAIPGVDDSKTKSEADRERLYVEIIERSVSWAVGVVEAEEIDDVGIYPAGLLAMRRAVEGLDVAVGHVLVDARVIPGLVIPQSRHVKGDAKSHSIAAASILAKVTRDRRMLECAEEFPGYGFDRHKGYGTEEHMVALRKHGPCEIHRKSYDVIAEVCGGMGATFYRLKEESESIRTAAELEEWENRIRRFRGELSDGECRRLRNLAPRVRGRVTATEEALLFELQ